MNIKNSLWITPFLTFFSGYYGLMLWWGPSKHTMPLLIGKTALETLSILSEYHLIPSIIAYKEKSGLPPGTILEQTPAWKSPVKERQSVYLVLSQEPNIIPPPDLIEKNKEQIDTLIQESSYTIKYLFAPHPFIKPNNCFATYLYPAQKNSVQRRIAAFIATQNQGPVVWPNFKHMPAQTVISFLQSYGIEPLILYPESPQKSEYWYIHEQYPAAGSFINPEHLKQIKVQLVAKEDSNP